MTQAWTQTLRKVTLFLGNPGFININYTHKFVLFSNNKIKNLIAQKTTASEHK